MSNPFEDSDNTEDPYPSMDELDPSELLFASSIEDQAAPGSRAESATVSDSLRGEQLAGGEVCHLLS